ncbi:hypothetical protein M378DRAFT_1055703 [Amanita muscaria Koide BX008]|uniref:Uncharacterized protein n=1 Tax=Amanita muscaria (strain Koide BX008) TaxID=946122 RepID=A0A0C2X0U3_AMAMK|nr:hypothetical protein M378DRAFT_1055703 [Amanita muscaria Koide BX008]
MPKYFTGVVTLYLAVNKDLYWPDVNHLEGVQVDVVASSLTLESLYKMVSIETLICEQGKVSKPNL